MDIVHSPDVGSGTVSRSQERLVYTDDGVCYIVLDGLPHPKQVESLIEDYVSMVELSPCELKVILLDISEMTHMQARTRQVFAELLAQASHHYGDRVKVVIAGGPSMIRKYTEILCRSLRFGNRTHSFDTLDQALAWVETEVA
jgi:hypothetical protein